MMDRRAARAIRDGILTVQNPGRPFLAGLSRRDHGLWMRAVTRTKGRRLARLGWMFSRQSQL